MQKVAIQGGLASFHDLAARAYFAPKLVEIAPCRTFRQVCQALPTAADWGLMAIENVLAGSILTNYALLQQFPLEVVGETYLTIDQHLMALPGQRLDALRSVRSHPMALYQCSRFLHQHAHLQVIEADDTAESARAIREGQLRGVAAIAGQAAAERYGLEIVAPHIADNPQNYTRFLVLRAGQGRDTLAHPPAGANKASVNFRLRHRVGALAAVLQVFARCGLDMSLIQSVPLPTHPSEITIMADLCWQDIDALRTALAEMAAHTLDVHVLGVYPAGAHGPLRTETIS